jgi:ribosomal-protein-alanine N-acetyltransferase
LTVSTQRLDLIPCSAELARALIRRRIHAGVLLGTRVPDDWPAQDLRDFLPHYVQQLEADPSLLGWGIWLMIHRTESVVIGDLGFKGKPDHEGTVEIGYSVVPAYRRRGYASEATRALVGWALARPGVRRVVAECAPDNLASIRVLEKLGMQRLGTVGSLLRWSRCASLDSGMEPLRFP